jgi:hypothetical protein
MGARPHWTPLGPFLDWSRRHAESEAEVQRMARGKSRARPEADLLGAAVTAAAEKILKAEVEQELKRGE